MLKRIVVAFESEDKHGIVHVFDVDQIRDEIEANAASDKLSSALKEVIHFAEHAANVCDDAHALHIDKDNYEEHLAAHPKAKPKVKAAPKKKAKKKKAKKAAAAVQVSASDGSVEA